jgi:hypothetical protein
MHAQPTKRTLIAASVLLIAIVLAVLAMALGWAMSGGVYLLATVGEVR